MGGSIGQESACNVGDQSWIPKSGRSPGEGNSYPLQYSCLENPTDRGAWQAIVHGVAEGQTPPSERLSLLLPLWLVRCPFLWCSRYSVCRIVPSPGFNQLREKGLLYYQRTVEEKWQFCRSLWMILCSKRLFTASFIASVAFKTFLIHGEHVLIKADLNLNKRYLNDKISGLVVHLLGIL